MPRHLIFSIIGIHVGPDSTGIGYYALSDSYPGSIPGLLATPDYGNLLCASIPRQEGESMQFRRITDGPTRACDAWGSGQFGAGRGSHSHEGLDVVSRPGQQILSPISGEVVREAHPYAGDSRYTGIVIRGTGQWSGYEVKMFYVQGFRSGPIFAGEEIGRAQDITARYPGITNHVHIEVRFRGLLLDPTQMFGVCF